MAKKAKAWDLLIKNALVFDGSGQAPKTYDIACKDGTFVATGSDLHSKQATTVIDGTGKWLMPGLIDIHTHFDLEVEVAPELPETVRHGTTSVVMSNCSLGIAFGKQEHPERPHERPIVDCFARVENIPKEVLAKCADTVTWDNTGDYLTHFEDLPLGPNVAPLVPHTMLRIEVMGLEDSIHREATETELKEMRGLLQKAMDEGYVGFSTDMLPLHFLANDPHRNAKIPTQKANYEEIKSLLNIVRNNERTWQATPNPEDPISTLKTFALTSGKLHGKPLKTTATAAMDLHTNKRGAKGIISLSKLLNSKWLQGDITFQALSAPFKVYADGVTTPLLEEKAAFRELNALDVSDREGRLKLLNDPGFIERFKHDWGIGKSGYNLDHLRRKMSMEPTTFSRDLKDMFIDTCPVECWHDENLEAIFQRLQQFQKSLATTGHSCEEEKEAFLKFPNPTQDDGEFILHLLREYDKAFRWYTVTANSNPRVLKDLLFHEETIPGFNDSGAHLTNMAFFDGNLRTLKFAAEDSIELVSFAVKRLTKDAADLFDLDAGTLELGKQADMILVDPEALLAYNAEANTCMQYREVFQHDQMVNRSDGVVDKTIIAGKLAWDGKKYTRAFGKERFGRPLRNKWIEQDLVSNKGEEKKESTEAA